MLKYSGGWETVKRTSGVEISKVLKYAKIGTTLGDLLYTSVFNNPGVGGWTSSPISVTSSVSVNAINGSSFADQQKTEDVLNSKTQYVNTSAPPEMQNIIYGYGNPLNDLKYSMQIVLDLGATNYTSLQISELTNTVVVGNKFLEVEAFDFGSGPFTGQVTLELGFQRFYGPIHLGIRLEDASGNSSVFDLNMRVYPTSNESIKINEQNVNLDLMKRFNLDNVVEGGNVDNGNPVGFSWGKIIRVAITWIIFGPEDVNKPGRATSIRCEGPSFTDMCPVGSAIQTVCETNAEQWGDEYC
jgi:hypothetical protein